MSFEREIERSRFFGHGGLERAIDSAHSLFRWPALAAGVYDPEAFAPRRRVERSSAPVITLAAQPAPGYDIEAQILGHTTAERFCDTMTAIRVISRASANSQPTMIVRTQALLQCLRLDARGIASAHLVGATKIDVESVEGENCQGYEFVDGSTAIMLPTGRWISVDIEPDDDAQ